MSDVHSEGFDLRQALGADETFALQKFSIYIPNKDRNGEPVQNIETWIEASMHLLAQINLGVTRLPWAQGIWKPSADAEDKLENTTVVFSYLKQPEVFQSRFAEIKEFLYEFADGANQGEVLVEFFGEALQGEGFYCRAYSITFNPPA